MTICLDHVCAKGNSSFIISMCTNRLLEAIHCMSCKYIYTWNLDVLLPIWKGMMPKVLILIGMRFIVLKGFIIPFPLLAWYGKGCKYLLFSCIYSPPCYSNSLCT